MSNQIKMSQIKMETNLISNQALESLLSSCIDEEGHLMFSDISVSGVRMIDGGEALILNRQMQNVRKFEIRSAKLDGILDFSELGSAQNHLLELKLEKCRLSEGSIMNLVENYLCTCFCTLEKLDLSDNILNIQAAKALSRFIEFSPFLSHLVL